MTKEETLFIKIITLPFKLIFLLVQAGLLAALLLAAWFLLQMYGVIPVNVPVAGASMLPTLPDQGYVGFHRYIADTRVQKYFHQTIGRGDIVVFKNSKTDKELRKQHEPGSGFVKRVVGIPGDMVVIKDGFVHINNQPQKEAYTLKPRSTFGGNGIHDCEDTHVPPNKLFVLGDNRKVSMDSREIGLIDIGDIDFYIPFARQSERFASLWRNPADDFSTTHQSLFDVQEYLVYLNRERRNNGLEPLKYESKLEKSARLRAEAMLKYSDFSFEAKASDYPMVKAMRDAGYSNIVFGEFPMTGYYDAKELFDAFIEKPNSAQFLLNKDYDDVGVSTFVGELSGCPVQVVVQHLAGYVPPNYSIQEINSWTEGLAALKNIQPGWEKLKEYEELYTNRKAEIDRINEIISLRIRRYEQIVAAMKANQWLSDEQKAWIDEEESLGKEQNDVAAKINEV